MTSGRYLAVHGMPGSGKSVLAAESVRDPHLSLNNFPGGVFWFKVASLHLVLTWSSRWAWSTRTSSWGA